MHLESFGEDVSLSSPTRLPVSARRLSQKVLLVLLSGRMWVRDLDGDDVGSGIGVHCLSELVEVLDEADDDLDDWDFGPGGRAWPVRRRTDRRR